MVTRGELIGWLEEALRPAPWAVALWEGGSAAFGRADAWSDVDLALHVQDGHVAEAWAAIEAAMTARSPIELRYDVPEPAWHGLSQRFYRLRDAGPHLLVDLCISTDAAPNRFTEVERHGTPRVIFDKDGVVAVTAVDPADIAAKTAARVAALRVTFSMFQTLVTRAVGRGRDLEALWAWHGFVLRPLVELLRVRYAPARHDFGMRYLDVDLPADVEVSLRDLAFVADLEDIERKHPAAVALFERTLSEIDATAPASRAP